MDGVFLQCKLINQKFLVFTIINTPQFSFTLRKVLKGGVIYVLRAANTLNPPLSKPLLLEKVLSHLVHSKSLSPLCTLMCLLRLLLSEKAFSHLVHSKGLSPLCIIMCLFNLLLLEKVFPHWIHSKDLSLECICMCTSRLFL